MAKLIINDSYKILDFGMKVNNYRKIFKDLFSMDYEELNIVGCIYCFKHKGDIIYIGCTNILLTRIKRHLLNDSELSRFLVNCLNSGDKIEIEVLHNKQSFNLENTLIKQHRPIFNKTI